ncbi:hypothetical protein [Medusavirus stheno T3]|uniref:Uncharacterized protein n=1 Tax=Medusavirus stheno T3 TaxID=3069717 RepID=A0A7S7YEQ2_9VIRU|nr:hypothetical protein QKU73_gp343 [Acanthamoeba castellanii medusavirus]QPB44432.1 hypothetical protein [Medusavirus stheno T3]
MHNMTSITGWTFRVIFTFFILDLFVSWVVPLVLVACIASGYLLSRAVEDLGLRVDGMLVSLALSAAFDHTGYVEMPVTPPFVFSAVVGLAIYTILGIASPGGGTVQTIINGNNVVMAGGKYSHRD